MSLLPLLLVTICVFLLVSGAAPIGLQALIVLILAIPGGVLFAILIGIALFFIWILFFFNSITTEYFFLWLALGIPAVLLGIATGLGFMAAPFMFASGSGKPGFLSSLRHKLLIIPLGLFRLVYRSVAWLHYFFVPHPSETTIKAARRGATPTKIDSVALAEAMKENVGEA